MHLEEDCARPAGPLVLSAPFPVSSMQVGQAESAAARAGSVDTNPRVEAPPLEIPCAAGAHKQVRFGVSALCPGQVVAVRRAPPARMPNRQVRSGIVRS